MVNCAKWRQSLIQYLDYRERRLHQTAYDEVAQQDVEALARAIHLLQEEKALAAQHEQQAVHEG